MKDEDVEKMRIVCVLNEQDGKACWQCEYYENVCNCANKIQKPRSFSGHDVPLMRRKLKCNI